MRQTNILLWGSFFGKIITCFFLFEEGFLVVSRVDLRVQVTKHIAEELPTWMFGQVSK